MRVQRIKFSEFMSGEYKRDEQSLARTNLSHRLAHSIITISPTAFLDWKILVLGGVVLTVAIAEKHLDGFGLFDITEKIGGIVRFILPASFAVMLIYFLSQLSF
jgi:hypothetical protein